MKKIIRDEFSNWKLWEVLWLGIACAVAALHSSPSLGISPMDTRM